jgi:hypothetical protein
MARWIACGGKVEIGDVIRWTEPVWYEYGKRARKKRKVMRVATQDVTAQVLTFDPKGFVYLEVMKCETGKSRYALEIEPLQKKDIIRRKRTTIARGGVERMEPKAEPVREKAVSKFLKRSK